MRHTISILVENKPGVLTRVTSLFARRGFNIDSLAVGETEDPKLSRITVVTGVDSAPLDQIMKQVYKLVNVIKVLNLKNDESISTELALFKIVCPPEKRPEVFSTVNVFNASVVDVTNNTVMVEATGSVDKLASLEDIFKGYGIKEMARTGVIALGRGE